MQIFAETQIPRDLTLRRTLVVHSLCAFFPILSLSVSHSFHLSFPVYFFPWLTHNCKKEKKNRGKSLANRKLENRREGKSDSA